MLCSMLDTLRIRLRIGSFSGHVGWRTWLKEVEKLEQAVAVNEAANTLDTTARLE